MCGGAVSASVGAAPFMPPVLRVCISCISYTHPIISHNYLLSISKKGRKAAQYTPVKLIYCALWLKTIADCAVVY